MTVRLGALRRRRKPSLRTRLRIFWVFIVTIVALAAYAGYVVVTLPALRATNADVRIAGDAVDRRDVLAAAAIDSRANAWLLDTARIETRIDAIPYVGTATVRRIPPAHIIIDVTQREPAACVRSGARIVTIDRERRILQERCAQATLTFIDLAPMALGEIGSTARALPLARLLADGRILSAASVGVRSLREDAYGQLIASSAGGVDYLLGNDSDLDRKAKLVAPVLAASGPGRVVRAVDLRSPATPILLYR